MSERASRELESVRDEGVKKFQKKLANVKAQATREVAKEKEKIQPPAPEPSPGASRHPLPLGEGQTVRIASLAVTGMITQVKGDEAEVLVGNMKLRRPLSDLEVVQTVAMNLPRNVHVSVSTKQLEKNEI